MRLFEIDVVTDTRSVVQTGTGDIQLEDPLPVRSADGDAVAFQQGTKMILFEGAEDVPVTAASTLESDWEFTSWAPDSSVLAAVAFQSDLPLSEIYETFSSLTGVVIGCEKALQELGSAN